MQQGKAASLINLLYSLFHQICDTIYCSVNMIVPSVLKDGADDSIYNA